MKINKKNIFIIVLVVIAVLVGLYFLIFKMDSKKYKYTKELKKIASEYYEDYYDRFEKFNYTSDQIEKELSKYKENGRKDTLDTLSRIDVTKTDEILSKFEGCNIHNTNAIVYPYEPYGKKDYKVVITLDCE